VWWQKKDYTKLGERSWDIRMRVQPQLAMIGRCMAAAIRGDLAH
jgi:hypothetical protein